ncbi:hypothetical protein [Streptomyces sp. NBC_01236]|uniref:hypothetical protein n=1 Tax=Streptomyces sp. NBC_01236 TaxID=2903789 RepID=UPI002E15A837|nr:hypothetical protein OG324_38300 [Streptomyces sp. NBC_01236]
MSDESRRSGIFIGYARKVYRLVRTIIFAFAILLQKSHRRHALKWLSSMRPGYLLRKPSPWIAFDAIDYLNAQSLEGRKVFEYGSGGSTLYWITRGAQCVSVEHDAIWHKKLNSRLSGIADVDYRLVSPTPLTSSNAPGRPDDPGAYISSNKNYLGHSFRSYASQIDEFPPRHFDLVMIDGRARPSCIRHAMSRLKPGGMLVVDNSDRPTYQQALKGLSSYSRVSFRGVVPQLVGWGQTDIFIKDRY